MPRHLAAAMAALACLLTACGAGKPGFALRPPAPEIVKADAGDVVDADEIVTLVGDVGAAARLEARAARAGYRRTSREDLAALASVMVIFRIPKDVTPLGAIAALEAMEPGTTAGVNHAYRPRPVRKRRGRRYAGTLIGWPAGGCRQRTPIGVVDGDLDTRAAALGGARIAVKRVADTAGDSGHGTAVVELLAGPGRLRGARILHAVALRQVAGRPPAAGVDAILRALDWMRREGVHLVNISLAGPYNKILDRGLQAASNNGMVIVAAAGNNGRGGPPRYPAALAATIAVTAVDGAGRAYRAAPEGPHVDVAAPGVDIFIESAPTGRYVSGTSFAAPFVTAAIAADPTASKIRSVVEIRRWLAANTRDLGPQGRDSSFGWGLVQAPLGCG